MIIAPDACDTMAALRDQIDRIDRELLELLAERAGYIDRAIVLKRRDNIPARTTGRVAEVIANVREGANRRGLDPDLIERIRTELIEAAIEHETKALNSEPS